MLHTLTISLETGSSFAYYYSGLIKGDSSNRTRATLVTETDNRFRIYKEKIDDKDAQKTHRAYTNTKSLQRALGTDIMLYAI